MKRITCFAWTSWIIQLVLHTTYACAQLVDPETAPDAIHDQVMKGFYILLETKKYAAEYAGDRLNCTNCHFFCGNTLGGEGNGLSLVGVTHIYPKKLPDGKDESLAERINACFKKSMHGKPLPIESEEMKAILSYLAWISKDIPNKAKISWLGVRKLRLEHKPDAKRGKEVYAVNCAMCHGKGGQGQTRQDDLSYPPLWGPSAFVAEAGMNKLGTLASFVYENMPYQNVGLTVEQAFDVAAFIVSQPHDRLGLMLNIIEQWLGIVHAKKKKNLFHDLDYLAGTWNQDDEDQFEDNIKFFESIDKELWK